MVKQSQTGAGESTKSTSLGARKQDDGESVELGPHLRVLDKEKTWHSPSGRKGKVGKGPIKRNTNTIPTQLIIRVQVTAVISRAVILL